jgi:anti-sigma B factor antagonist
MQFTAETVDGVTVLTYSENAMTSTNAGEFRREVTPFLEAGGRLVLDLRRVSFLDSSALGILLACLRQLNEAGGDLKLCGLTKQVRQVIELVRFNRVFDILESREQAVAAFAKG